MVELRNRRIVIDGKPVLIFAGEIHYFRLKRSEWEDRITKAKQLGCNAIASYIPWIVHEEVEGEIDVTGRFKPENDLGAFIDACHRHGLWFIARPGPFVMAEMKNEGIPFWFYKRYPEAIPVSWEGQKATTKTLSFLHHDFLACAKRWYAGVMPVLAKRLQPNGGPVIGVQLDNEIGMLSWVSNQPDLSDDTLCEFATWVGVRYSSAELDARYPFDFHDPSVRARALRNPAESFAAALHRDLGNFERDYFRRYVATLRTYAEASGVRGVPFIVNIHGSGGGRGTQFPIGISQLFEAYTQESGYLSGSDHYLGELTRDNAPDLYFLNAFMEAGHRPEQPLASMEFEVGTGDYGEIGAVRQSAASADMKIRISITQGNRLLNYYLLTGGRNPMLRVPVGDGNDRIAFTGERHGFAAPINPEGEIDLTGIGLGKTTHRLQAVAPWLADMDEVRDPIALAFIPDYYKTNYHRPGPMQDIVRGVEAAREGVANLTRILRFQNASFTAIDLQNRTPNPKQLKLIAFSSGRYLDKVVQQRLADFVHAGGRLLMIGELPILDMEGQPCDVLARALEVRPLSKLEANSENHVSVKGVGPVAFEPEVRAWQTATFASRTAELLLPVVGSGVAAGLLVRAGVGRAVLLGFNYPYHTRFYRALLEWLEVTPALSHDDSNEGLLLTMVANAKGERMLSVINLDGHEREFLVSERGERLFGGHPIHLAPRESKLLPIGLNVGASTIGYATAELTSLDSNHLRFARSAQAAEVSLRTRGEARRVRIEAGTGEQSIPLA